MFDDIATSLDSLDQQVDDAERINRIRRLEALKAQVAAAQAREVAAFVASQHARQRGVTAQIALARRISPFEATRYVHQVTVLVHDLPNTFSALARGRVCEYRALTVARESAWLSPADRRAVDEAVAPDLHLLGTRKLVDRLKRVAYELDPHAALARLDIAANDRHVSVRPAADSMARLTALLPLTQAVAAYAALHQHAAASVGVGAESRTRSQLMADTLVERVTGQHRAAEVPVTVNLIMSDQTLLGHGAGSHEPATIVGGGVIPAELARRATDTASLLLLRKLYASPSGQLVTMESAARCFTEAQRTFLLLRDQRCRTPWCDAPIRHADHIEPAETGGRTSLDNGQGLCEACNYAKTAPGWRQYRDADETVTVTPTGHTYRSRAPAAA